MNTEQKTKRKNIITFLVLLGIYIAATIFVRSTSGSQQLVKLFGTQIPASAFTGVLSALANMSTILMVVYLGKAGFYVALVMIVSQLPGLAMGIIKSHNMMILPGVFNTLLVLVAIIIIYRRNIRIEEYRQHELDKLQSEKKLAKRLFEQTATSLVSSIDAKDVYSHGHSLRVAEYSRKIAEELGKSENECEKIYYTALLHDVGKIGIADNILTKNGRLTKEEYEEIKKHSDIGRQILEEISEFPFISVGAHYHHERYDGKGYPEGLKGDEIPEVARIISVADSYDAMTSNRSYRDAMPQQIVREEIVKGSGTQFDPEMAKVMQHLIDIDSEYQMKESVEKKQLIDETEILCADYRSAVSDSIWITSNPVSICLDAEPDENAEQGIPSLVVFDSLDAKYHDPDTVPGYLNYFEYAEISFDGVVNCKGARKTEVNVTEHAPAGMNKNDRTASYEIEAVKYKDHALIKISGETRDITVIVALTDNTRFAYIGLTGEHCLINNVRLKRSEEAIGEGHIKRIAPEITYTDGPQGDLPNIQIDGYRTTSTAGIPITDGLKVSFHSMTLPNAGLIWHCPYIVLCNRSDGDENADGYREYSFIRIDGENWQTPQSVKNEMVVEKNESFPGWDAWKLENKQGFECVVSFERTPDKIIMATENFGIKITSTTYLNDRTDAFAVLTGDQCALTNIRIGS